MNDEKIRQLEAERDALLKNWKPKPPDSSSRREVRRGAAAWWGKLNGWLKYRVRRGSE